MTATSIPMEQDATNKSKQDTATHNCLLEEYLQPATQAVEKFICSASKALGVLTKELIEHGVIPDLHFEDTRIPTQPKHELPTDAPPKLPGVQGKEAISVEGRRILGAEIASAQGASGELNIMLKEPFEKEVGGVGTLKLDQTIGARVERNDDGSITFNDVVGAHIESGAFGLDVSSIKFYRNDEGAFVEAHAGFLSKAQRITDDDFALAEELAVRAGA